jgi:tetratricopeptide (TPR) repeat protein
MNFLKNLLLVFVLLVVSVALDGAQSHYDAAVDVLRSDQDFARAVQYLEVAVGEAPRNGEYKQLLGTCYFKTGRSAEAIEELEAAIALLGWENSPSVIGNLLEALSAENRYDEALEVSAKATQTHPDSMQIVYNSATIRQRRGRYEEAVPLFLRVNALDPSFQEAYERAIDCLLELQIHGYAELGQIKAYTQEAINKFPQAHMFPYLMGVSLHKEGRLTEALEWYGRARQMRPEYLPNLANIGAIYQGMGDVNNALGVYSQLLPLMPADAGIRNNYGSLLGAMGRRDEGLYWLLEAYRLNPQFSNVNINLGSYYAEEGDPAQAAYYLQQAIPYTDKPNALRIRIATALSPVSPSWDHMVRERASFEVSVLALIHEASSSSSS